MGRSYGNQVFKLSLYAPHSGADPDRGERGSSHGQIFLTLEN